MLWGEARLTRRDVAKAAGAMLLARHASAAGARIDILPDEKIGAISPDLHGQFTEHIGGVVYDGIWVGEKSRVPNVGGIRKALVDAMQPLHTSVVRWPGGCFADSYNWRDGVGPQAQRPRQSNFWINELEKAPDGPQKYDPNEFGTNEFLRFCRLAGAEPYLAANLRSLPAKDFYEWVEYCNSPADRTSLGALRGAGGNREPFRVRYWGIGNESWGCGGNFLPEEYAVEYRRFTSWVPRYGVSLRYIASGPNGHDLNWTRGFFSEMARKSPGALRSVYGWALHYYCGTAGKGDAVDYTEDDWYTLLAKANGMEPLIEAHWAAMGETDPEHRVKLIVDEWGAWHKTGTEMDPRFLFGQMPTMRDALITGITLDTFHRHADKVVMANVAQLINNLHTLFLAHEDRFVKTTNYHVFRMYTQHHNGESVRTVFGAPRARQLPGLLGSASVHGREVVLSVVNPHATEARDCEVAVRGATVRSWRSETLAAEMHAHNTFDQPDAVTPGAASGEAGAPFIYTFPAGSVTVLRLSAV